MSVVRLNVPPFTPAAPTSLAALRRPLVQPELAHCANHCQPCETCRAAHAAEVAAASKHAADTALRLSQLVEDALTQHIARLEAEQTQLVTTVLGAVLPHLANASLRAALTDELRAISDPLKTLDVRLAKPPSLDIGQLPAGHSVTLEDDPNLFGQVVEVRIDSSTTRLDADALVNACVERLNSISAEETMNV